jgi:hypothetical protein
MKISRYIYVPFVCGASYALINYLLISGGPNRIIWDFVSFALFGFAILLYNDYKIRKLTTKDNKEAFSPRQKRDIVLFTNYDRAFDLCFESVGLLRKARVTSQNKQQGIIKAKKGMNWYSFGSKINFKLLKVTEFTTQIEITIEPLLQTTLVDYGESFKTAEELNKFFRGKNDEANKKGIAGNEAISAEFYSENKNTKVEID